MINTNFNMQKYLLKKGYNKYISSLYKEKPYDFSDISKENALEVINECDFEIITNNDGTMSLKDLQEINLGDIEDEFFNSFKEILERLEGSYLQDYFIGNTKEDILEYILSNLEENLMTSSNKNILELYEKYDLYDGDVRNLIKRIANDDKKLIELNEKIDFISNPELNKEQLNKLFNDFVYPEIEIQKLKKDPKLLLNIILLDNKHYNFEKNIVKIEQVLEDKNIYLDNNYLIELTQKIEKTIIENLISIDNKDEAKQYIKVANINKQVCEYILSVDEYFVEHITNLEFLNDKIMMEKYVLFEGDFALLGAIGDKIKNDPSILLSVLNFYNDYAYGDDYKLDSFHDLVHHGDAPEDIIGNKLKQQIIGFLTKNNLDASSITNEELANLSKGKDKEIKQFLENLSLMQKLKKEITTLLGNEEKIIDNSITNLIKLAVSTKQIDNTLDFLLVSNIQHIENSTETWIEIIRPILANELKIDESDVDKKYFNKYFEPEIEFNDEIGR